MSILNFELELLRLGEEDERMENGNLYEENGNMNENGIWCVLSRVGKLFFMLVFFIFRVC